MGAFSLLRLSLFANDSSLCQVGKKLKIKINLTNICLDSWGPVPHLDLTRWSTEGSLVTQKGLESDWREQGSGSTTRGLLPNRGWTQCSVYEAVRLYYLHLHYCTFQSHTNLPPAARATAFWCHCWSRDSQPPALGTRPWPSCQRLQFPLVTI